jgi:hypothetical protein
MPRLMRSLAPLFPSVSNTPSFNHTKVTRITFDLSLDAEFAHERVRAISTAHHTTLSEATLSWCWR